MMKLGPWVLAAGLTFSAHAAADDDKEPSLDDHAAVLSKSIYLDPAASGITRDEARHAFKTYFEDEADAAGAEPVRIVKLWTEKGKYFAKIRTHKGAPLGTYSMDLRTAEIQKTM